MGKEFISDTLVAGREVYEEVKDFTKKGVLRVIRGPVAEWINLNRNNRMYSERLWDRVLASSYVKEQLMYKTLFGEGNHPTDRYEVDFARVSHVIWDMWKVPESNQIYAEIAILDTPLGRILNTLYEAGGIIGYSSRAGGTLHQRKGFVEVDENDYNFVTFDAVPYPSVVAARPQEVLESVVESVNVELPDEIHTKLCTIIKESGLENKDVIKDFIYSIKGFNMEKEIQLLEGVEKPLISKQEPAKSDSESRSLETTLSLLKESSLQINNLRAENQTLTADNVSLKVENESLKKNLNESLSKITELMSDSKSISQDMTVAESRFNDTIVELKKQINLLEGVIDDKDLEILDLRGVEEACRVLRQENEGIKSSLKALNEEKQNSEQSVAENTMVRNELKDAYQEISSMVSESLKKDDEIRSLTESVQQLKKELESSQAKEAVVDTSVVESLKLENAELNSKIKSLTESTDSMSGVNESLQERCKQYKSDLVSVICSGYNLNPEDVMNQLKVGFTKSDVYCVCESMSNSVKNGIDFGSVIITESSEDVSRQVDNPVSDPVRLKSWIGQGNRRGLGLS